jgi:glycosyltransferase involved in cell wall biosynthesis
MNNNPKVSIISTTYNHEKYIRAALDGFIAQKTNFSFEVIIADDHSKDKTPKIIQEYADKYPHLIKTIIRSKNMGVVANMVDVLQRARGKYIAICEGDDFWTDEKNYKPKLILWTRILTVHFVFTRFVYSLKKASRRMPFFRHKGTTLR